MKGEQHKTAVCSDCLMPRCPYCECCTTPVWAVPLMFQCQCGYSGLMDVHAMPEDAVDVYRLIWLPDAQGMISAADAN